MTLTQSKSVSSLEGPSEDSKKMTQEYGPMVAFQSGSPMMIVGPTNSGKTFWVRRLLSHQMFTEPIHSILYCYGVHQSAFDNMKSQDLAAEKITFHQGLPDKAKLEEIHDGNFHVVVLDDLMEHIVKSEDMQQLFTKYCHHMNITAIFISQNIFHQGPRARTISLNSHVIVLFSNKRDESQIRTFARQIYPTKWKRFLDVYERNMNHEYSYLVIDCTPSHPREIKVRTSIFPGETTYTFDI